MDGGEESNPQLEPIVLTRGTHASADEGLCAMEAVAFLGREQHTDHPRCACPVLSAFARPWNDGIEDDGERTRIFLPLLEGIARSKASSWIELARAHLALDWIVREHLPEWLALRTDLRVHGERLRALPPIRDDATARAAGEVVREAARAAALAWSSENNAAIGAARITARDAAGRASRDSAWDGAFAAAFSFVKSATILATVISEEAALDGAVAATSSLASKAARDAAWVTAWLPALRGGSEAARAVLNATEKKMAASAVTLFTRMMTLSSDSATAPAR